MSQRSPHETSPNNLWLSTDMSSSAAASSPGPNASSAAISVSLSCCLALSSRQAVSMRVRAALMATAVGGVRGEGGRERGSEGRALAFDVVALPTHFVLVPGRKCDNCAVRWRLHAVREAEVACRVEVA